LYAQVYKYLISKLDKEAGWLSNVIEGDLDIRGN
jgi:hypothetical protein